MPPSFLLCLPASDDPVFFMLGRTCGCVCPHMFMSGPTFSLRHLLKLICLRVSKHNVFLNPLWASIQSVHLCVTLFFCCVSRHIKQCADSCTLSSCPAAALIRGNRNNCTQFSNNLDWLVSKLERLESSSGTLISILTHTHEPAVKQQCERAFVQHRRTIKIL